MLYTVRMFLGTQKGIEVVQIVQRNGVKRMVKVEHIRKLTTFLLLGWLFHQHWLGHDVRGERSLVAINWPKRDSY